MYQIFYIFLIFGNTLSQNIDGDIDSNGPEPLIPHTSVDNPATVTLGNIDGCMCREIPGKMSVFYGATCKTFPKSVKVKAPVLKFRNSIVNIIHKDDFQMLDNITYMEIESNTNLYKLEPGCFLHMNKLTNLSISFNEKITYFDDNLFEGLFNLQEIYLRNNGIKNILDVTQALSIKYVPKLLSLILNRNELKEMSKNDFLPMKGTSLETLNLVLCQIDYIHPDVLKPLSNLTALRLGENLFSVSVITRLIRKTIGYGIPLKILNLYEVGFRGTPPKELLNIIAKSNITYLNLGRNRLEHIRDDTFPAMPNLEVLVLRDSVIVEITKNAFSKMTKLKYLCLTGNRLTYLHSGLLLKTLMVLDVSANSYTDTSFHIPSYIFKGMSTLQQLLLSYNQIESIYASTFVGLENLIILELNNCQISFIEDGSFIPLKNLKRLNLENNFLGSDMIVTKDFFKGLENLQVLLLGGCHLLSISSKDSIFEHLPNLYYLGLQRNDLHIISSNQFLPTVNLNIIDLAENNLSPWEKQLFLKSKIQNLNIAQNKLFTITKEMLKDFLYLEVLILDGNPLSCDCNWYPTSKMLNNNTLIAKPSLITDSSVMCVSPEKWHRYTVSEYLNYLNTSNECIFLESPNNIFLISFFTLFIIVLVCLLVFCYIYRWNIRYWLFLAQKEILRRRKNIKGNKKTKALTDYTYTYDAFVSYSNEDQEFVDKLVTVLENTDPVLKLCVYERDFQIGTVISESVMQNIAMSRRIVLIISNSFAKSQWCRWEMHLAECHQMNDGSDEGLILIVLEKVSKKYMTPFLKYIIKSRIYVEWDSDERKTVEFWDRLRNTLLAPKNIT